jgi:putative SOS response-associated peptidase YedK
MPVILPDEAWERWLASARAEPAELLGLLVPTEDVALRVHAVGRGVNDVRRDGPDLIEPLEAEPDTAATLGI